MFYESNLQFLLGILKKCGIHAETVRVDDGLRLPTGEALPQVLQNAKHATVYTVSDRFGCRYIYFRLPETAQSVLFVGPYLVEAISERSIMALAEQHHLPPSTMHEIYTWHTSIPILPENSPVYHMLEQFYDTIWGSGRYSLESTSLNDEAPIALAQSNTDPHWLMQALEQRYSVENALLDAVSSGQLQKAERNFARFSPEFLEERTTDNLRNVKNYCIIMNTLLRKAAEKGGVHPLFLDRVSSDYALAIERFTSPSAVGELMHEMLKGYCLLVQNHATGQYSSLVQRAILAIDRDLSADLSLRVLAQQLNSSGSYLSTQFKKETGQTVTAFIITRRIRLAKQLLRTTALQIQTVALHCGFPDVNYFSKTFKKMTGRTPKSYRSGAE